MTWSGGKFTRTRNWVQEAAAGIKILASNHDDEDNNFANGIDECLTKNGKNVPTTNLSMAGFKITNLGSPTADQDAATRRWVQDMTGWPTSKNIEGADTNGRLNFTSTTGVNGVTWTNAQMALVGKPAKENETAQRLAITNTNLPSTTSNAGDVFIVDEAGRTNFPTWTQNFSYDPVDGKWRTINPGYGSYLTMASGTLSFAGNRVATVTDLYAPVTAISNAMSLTRGGVMTLFGETTASLALRRGANNTSSANRISGQAHDGQVVWNLDIGDATVQSANSGLDYRLTAYDDAGTAIGTAMRITRSTRAVSFYGSLITDGLVRSDTGRMIAYDADAGAQPSVSAYSGDRSASRGFWTATNNTMSFGSTDNVGDPVSTWATLDATALSSVNALRAEGDLLYIGAGGLGRCMTFTRLSGSNVIWGWDWETSDGTLVWRRGTTNSWGAQFLPSGDFMIYNNTASKQAAGQWVAYSDARLKTVGGEYKAGLAEILKIVPKHYRLKDDEEKKDFVGIIGQEIEPVMPETVKRVKGEVGGKKIDDLLQFDPTNIMYALVNAVKELSAKLDAATARIAELEAKA